MTAIDVKSAEFRARRRYAASLRYRDTIKYRCEGAHTDGSFIAVTKDRLCVSIDTGNARKYIPLETLVMPAVPPKPARPLKAKRQASAMPAKLRKRLGLV